VEVTVTQVVLFAACLALVAFAAVRLFPLRSQDAAVDHDIGAMDTEPEQATNRMPRFPYVG
jgi:hypothetical protein